MDEKRKNISRHNDFVTLLSKDENLIINKRQIEYISFKLEDCGDEYHLTADIFLNSKNGDYISIGSVWDLNYLNSLKEFDPENPNEFFANFLKKKFELN